MKRNKKIFLLIILLTTFLNAKDEYIKFNDNSSSKFRNTEARGIVSVAIGMNALSTSEGSLSLGYGPSANAINSIAIGRGTNSNSRSSIAIGETAIANAESSISIGSQSISKREKEEYGFNILKDKVLTNLAEIESDNNKLHIWQATKGSLSIGDEDNRITRQITAVAAGTKDSDAVNLAQLKALANASFNIHYENDGLETAKLRDVNIKFSNDFNINKEDEKIVISLKNNREIRDGRDGKDGENGKSAYEIWKELDDANKDKSEKEFIESLKGKSDTSGIASAVSLAMIPSSSNNNLSMSVGMYEKSVSLALGLNGKVDRFSYKAGLSVNDKGKVAGGFGVAVSLEEEKDIFSEIETLKKENMKLKEMIEEIYNKNRK